MTAEIVVMNKSAVALAADSAVTIQTDEGQKIYNSVNKLFALSKHHPIGVMIYGAASLNGIPWELLIKEYRDHIQGKEFDLVEDYASDFLAYLLVRSDLITADVQKSYVASSLYAVFSSILVDLNGKIKKASSGGKISLTEIKKLGRGAVLEHLKYAKTKSWLPGKGQGDADQIEKDYADVINEVRDIVFKKFPFSVSTKKALSESAGRFFVTDDFLSMLSGLVFAGFGRKNNFPSVRAYELEGVIAGSVKYKAYTSEDLDVLNGAGVFAFAQKEEVQKFTSGIHPKYYDVLLGIFEEHSKIICQEAEKAAGNSVSKAQKNVVEKAVEKAIVDAHRKLMKRLPKSINDYQFNVHSKPIIEAVSFLPKDELAAMAESLVNLTSFRHRMSMNAETVGGPIDVAVISRGDGFIWIKRKHYFNRELNHHFFHNYF